MVDIVYSKEYRAYMKMAKSYKIVILLTAFIASLILAFSMMNVGVVNALTAPSSTSTYIEVANNDSVTLNDQAETLDVALTKTDSQFGFKSQLVIDDFGVEFKVDGEYQSVSLVLTYDSYLVNGVKNADGEYDKQIENSIVIEKVGKAYFAGQKDADKVDVDLTNGIKVEIKVVNGFFAVSVNGTALTTQTDAYYKVGFVDKPVADVDFAVVTDNDVKVALSYVDQKVSDSTGAYKQTFESTDGKLTNDDVLPRVNLNDSFFTVNASGEKSIIKNVSTQYTLTLAPYSVLNNVKSSDVYLARPENSDIWLAVDTEKPKKIMFPAVASNVEFYVTVSGLEVDFVEKYSAQIQDPENTNDQSAPVYVENAEALESFKQAVIKATQDGDHYIALGTEFEIPSMADLVFDDTTPYEDLTARVYYKNATQTRTSNELSFKVDEAGDYTFYVVFTDAAGNAIKLDSIVDEDDDGELVVKNKALVFSFYIADNAPIKVEAPTTVGAGFVGVKFTAPSFNVDASGCKTTYKLYFNSNEQAKLPTSAEDIANNGWIEIPVASKISDKKYEENGYDYDDIKNIAYDGKVTFVPDKVGSYVIECYAVSEITHRSDTDFAIVRVSDTPTEVKVPSNWLQNNVWSVVFLSIGTLCLIGIVVLLFIKPKDETESD